MVVRNMKKLTGLRRFLFSPMGIAIVLLWVVYAVLTFLAPQSATSREQFGLSATMIVFLQLSIALPYLVLWVSVGYSAACLRQITESSLRIFAKYFSWALYVLLAGMILPTFLSTTRNIIHENQNIVVPLTILLNLVYAIFPIIGYWLMCLGLQTPSPTTHQGRLFSRNQFMQAVGSALVIAMPFIWFVFTNVNRRVTLSPNMPATYYLSDPFIVLLVILPTIVGWALGLLVAFRASDAFSLSGGREDVDFFNGIFLIVLSSIFLQGLISIGSQRLFSLGLATILFLIYLFIVFQLIGYITLTRNVRKLLD